MRLRTTAFRAHHPRWSFQPTSGEGAARHGGRFNPVGVPAFYTSLRPETAWLEAQQGFPFKAQPMTMCGYVVDCENIADLTVPATRTSLGVDHATLGCSWEDMASRGLVPPSWELAGRLRAAGFAGILVPSFAVGATASDVNAVFWIWEDEPPHQVRLVDDYARLPRDDRSWH